MLKTFLVIVSIVENNHAFKKTRLKIDTQKWNQFYF